jgi:hypothetical protein
MGTVRDLLLTRRNELTVQREPLAADVTRLREQLSVKQSQLLDLTLEIDQIDSALKAVEDTETKSQLTIKQAVLEVLKDRADGMTALDILAEINTRFFSGRVTRTSLSPQLSRLKDDDGKIELKGNKWFYLPPQPNLFPRRI